MVSRAALVGFGKAGGIHERNYPGHVKIAAAVDPRSQSQASAREKGYETFASLDEALTGIKPDFWDICAPTEHHYPMTRKILEIYPSARIMIEKPVSAPHETTYVRNLEKDFPDSRLSVEEPILGFQLFRMAAEFGKKYIPNPQKIEVEATKNAVADVMRGRSVDKDLGIFGAETPHQLDCIANITNINPVEGTMTAGIGSMALPDGRVLPNQGWGEISYQNDKGTNVHIFTSMEGKIKFGFPLLDPPAGGIPVGDLTRWRVMNVVGDDYQIKTRYEYAANEIFAGRLFVTDSEGKLIERRDSQDKCFEVQIRRILDYFTGAAPNPSPVGQAADKVDLLATALSKASK